MSNSVVICFVLNGLLNGEDGVSAVDTSGLMLADGWYFTDENHPSFPDALGPYYNRDLAVKASQDLSYRVEDDLGEASDDIANALAALKRGDVSAAKGYLNYVLEAVEGALKDLSI